MSQYLLDIFVGLTLTWIPCAGQTFFKRLVRNGYSQFKRVAVNHFVAFFFLAVVPKLPNLPVII